MSRKVQWEASCDACGVHGKHENEDAARGMGWGLFAWAEHRFDICPDCGKKILSSFGIAKRVGIQFVASTEELAVAD